MDWILKKWLLAGIAGMAVLTAAAEKSGHEWDEQMTDLDPAFREHLQTVLTVIAGTEDGQFILEKVSPKLEFRTKPMKMLGLADGRNVITLEQLRLENSAIPDTSAAHDKVKVCYTAEILSHELLHNAQFQEGLFTYPAGFSGFEALLCERLLELEAKLTGEKMYDVLTEDPQFKGVVPPKSGLFLVMKRQSKDPLAEYCETLWSDLSCGSRGTKLYSGQIREIAYWNTAYAEQGFRNAYGRFLAGVPGIGEAALKAHLQKIIDFRKLPVTPEWLLERSPVRAIPHGVAVYENGVKVLELEAVQGGYVRRQYQGGMVRETMVK